jgi:mannose-6-phosphate isomerase-like protein (cupin superfamily)
MMRRSFVLLVSLVAAGIAAAGPPARDVTRIDAAAVRAAFAKGMPLLENDAYKVHASRREAPGQAEVHTRDTDVLYVLEGNATLVTGGSVVDGKTVAPDEIRGASIDGGTPRAIAPGDVVVIPNGVPHWFRDVAGPILYSVVTVTAPDAAR